MVLAGLDCPELSNIADFFGLDETDVRVVAFLYSWESTHEFESFCNSVCRHAPRSKAMSFIADAVKSEPRKVAASIKRLREKKVTEYSSDIFPSLTGELREYICEYDGGSVAEKFSKRMNIDKTFSLSEFPVDPSDTQILLKTLASGKPRHVLFYGKPGCGKTEFAKALARELGKDIYIPSRESRSRRAELSCTAIGASIYAAGQSSSIALVDEADEFLETEQNFFGMRGCNDRKGAVNEIMDASSGPVIWIVNSIGGIDPSTRRRFSYSVGFEGISEAQKASVINNSLKARGLGGELAAHMKTIARRYCLSVAGIALVIERAADISADDSELRANMEKIAKTHYELLAEKKAGAPELGVDERFDPELLNIDFPLEKLSEGLENYSRACEKSGKLSASFLFSGAPGTGKTQLGRFIAQKLGRELLLKRMSDLTSCYVGETEKNIRSAFREASATNSVLMIDEADSIFYDRRNASHSWETSFTNEILSQMEAFDGVFICTTNFSDKMDAAAMRRFDWKIKFSPTGPEGRVKLYSKYFLGGEAPSAETRAALAEMEGLCPGDFKAARQKTRFISDTSDAFLLGALRDELKYKEGASDSRARVGFC